MMRNETEKQSEMVFTMGLPGAGKSTALGELGLLASHQVIDCDLIKKTHPEYDPKAPELVHAWSQAETEKVFANSLVEGGNWIMDGTGTDVEKMVRRMKQAKAAGFTIRLFYVKVSLETSLLRNSLRERVVPEEVVRSKALDIVTAFEIIAPHADTVEIFDNDSPRS